jgi:hypothetical protein
MSIRRVADSRAHKYNKIFGAKFVTEENSSLLRRVQQVEVTSEQKKLFAKNAIKTLGWKRTYR